MDNDVFVNKLIKGTKDGEVNWQPVKSKEFSNDYKKYYLQVENNKLLLEKYNSTEYDIFGDEISTVNCSLSVCDDTFNSLSEIYEDDLKISNGLIRLYRLVERKANNVDNIMEKFVEGINGTDGMDF